MTSRTSVIAMGGSTTECFYLSDDSCWTALLSERLKKKFPDIWINNAGYQGHSTFGNLVLLNEYVKKLSPKYVLLLEGIIRLGQIVDTCVAAGIKPILITQPLLFGYGNDCITGADLALYNVADIYNGEIVWNLLEQYNAATRKIAKEKAVPVIDLAHKLPKCSRYFYDICHFTNQGSVEVSRILAESLVHLMR